jgi:hypothetical protein
MKLKKYKEIHKMTYRALAEKLNDPEKRKKYGLDLLKISHVSVRSWTIGRCKPSLFFMKILQTMTHGKVSIKDFE